jgi:hypothetical protein
MGEKADAGYPAGRGRFSPPFSLFQSAEIRGRETTGANQALFAAALSQISAYRFLLRPA